MTRPALLLRARRIYGHGRFLAAFVASLVVHGTVAAIVLGARFGAAPYSGPLVVELRDVLDVPSAAIRAPGLPAVEPPPNPLLALEAEREALRLELATLSEEKAALTDELQAAEIQAARRTAAHAVEVEALKGAEAELGRKVASLVAEKATLTSEVTAARAQAAALEAALAEQRAAEEAALAEMKATYRELVAALQGQIAAKEVALREAKEGLTVSIVDRVLFPSGQATLTPEGRTVIARVGTVLARVRDRRILVEGHTDDVPIGPELRRRFPSNWELSTARATEVVRYLIERGEIAAERLEAVGRADTDPVTSNLTEEGRRQNRRIEIIMLPPRERRETS